MRECKKSINKEGGGGGGLTAPLIRVSEPKLLSTLNHLRRVEAALLGCRGGQPTYSATGRLADVVHEFHTELKRGGCFFQAMSGGTSSSSTTTTTASQKQKQKQKTTSKGGGIIGDAFRTTTAAAAATAARRADATGNPAAVVDAQGRIVNVLPAGSALTPEDGGGGGGGGGGGSSGDDGSISSPAGIGLVTVAVIVSTALAVSLIYYAFFVAPSSRTKAVVNRRTSSVPGGGGGGSGIGGGIAGSARRFYRHLEAGSANDLPLVEDLDKVPNLNRDSGRGGESTDNLPYLANTVDGGAQAMVRKRSNSISEPARPPVAPLSPVFTTAMAGRGGGGGSGGSGNGGISMPTLRHHPGCVDRPLTAKTDVAAGDVRVEIPPSWRRDSPVSSRPSTPPHGSR